VAAKIPMTIKMAKISRQIKSIQQPNGNINVITAGRLRNHFPLKLEGWL